MKTIQQKIAKYNLVRGWNKLPPADIAKSIIIESAELLEHFQWSGEYDKSAVSTEVADIFIYLTTFCQRTEIDLQKAVLAKLAQNEKKYPVEQIAKGINTSFYLQQKKKYRQKMLE